MAAPSSRCWQHPGPAGGDAGHDALVVDLRAEWRLACASTANCWRRACSRARPSRVGVSPRRLRRALAADDARPLSLWLRRADHQPGAAAALCQRTVAATSACRRRPGGEGAHPGCDLPRAELPVLVRQLRPVVAGLRRSVARRLRHRLPDPGAREELRRAAEGDRQALATCRTRSPTTSTSRAAATRSPMRSMCWRATRRPRSATCATTPTRKLEAFTSPMAVAHLAASLALYGDSQRSERTFQAALTLAKSKPEVDWYRSDYGSRCATAPRCWRSPPRANPMPSVVPELVKLRRGRARKVRWTEHAGRGLDAARRPRASPATRRRSCARCRRHSRTPARYHGHGHRRGTVGKPIDVINNTGKDPLQAVVTTVAAPKPAAAGRRRRLRHQRTYYRSTAARPTSPRRSRTSASSWC
jgi:hypothetical protein